MLGGASAASADITPQSPIICDPYDSYDNFTTSSKSYVR